MKVESNKGLKILRFEIIWIQFKEPETNNNLYSGFRKKHIQNVKLGSILHISVQQRPGAWGVIILSL